MEKKIKDKDLKDLRQTAMFEAQRLKAMQIMLDEDHRHEEELRTSLTFYLCCLNRLFNTRETAEVWDGYLKDAYNRIINSADNRFKGFRDDVEHLLFELEVERRKADEAEKIVTAEKERRKAERALAKAVEAVPQTEPESAPEPDAPEEGQPKPKARRSAKKKEGTIPDNNIQTTL